MRMKPLTLLIGAALLAGSVLPSTAWGRDWVRETAARALAQAPTPTPAPGQTGPDEPPPTRSQVMAQQQREEAARAVAEQQRLKAEMPYYKKWWFWVLTAAVVGGTVALGAWAVEPSTTPARACSVGVIGCFGDGRTQP
jgi:hypothetical protein